MVITQLHDKMILTYKDLLLSYMNQNYINTTDVKDIDPNKSDQFLQMYFGIKVLQELQKPLVFKNNALLDDFYSRTQNFLKVACLQIKKKIQL